MKAADISPCGKYRYLLSRTWDSTRPDLVFCMLNPSTADATADDPTVRKCMRFAAMNHYGGIKVVNLFAWRATDPKELWIGGRDLVGPENAVTLFKTFLGNDVVLAWGAHARRFAGHANQVRSLALLNASRVFVLRKLDDGTPAHPLMLPYACKLTPIQSSE